jgi:hypothetical protein
VDDRPVAAAVKTVSAAVEEHCTVEEWAEAVVVAEQQAAVEAAHEPTPSAGA